MFFIILGSVLWVIFAFWPAIVARRKGYSFALFFIMSLFLFFISLIIAYAVKDRTLTAKDIADQKAADRALAQEEA